MAEKVVIYTYDFRNDRDVASGSIIWDGKKMSANGLTATRILQELAEAGIGNPRDGSKKKYFPKDGTKFLELLKVRYNNAYLRASDVIGY